MLGKLMKYELKATARTLIPLYIALLAFATINKIFIGTGLANKFQGFGSIPFMLSIIAYIFTMAAVVIVTLFVIIQRFYKNLLGDEGYLMNTLPVNTTTNITSKLSIATFWNIISGLVAILSIVIMAFNPHDFSEFFHELFILFAEGFNDYGVQIYIVIIEIIISGLISIASFTAMIYASMSIGHLFTKHRVLLSFAAFIVLNIISSAISSFVTVTLGIIGKSMHINLEISSAILGIHMVLIYIIIFNLIFFIAYFIITHYILKNKLNLE